MESMSLSTFCPCKDVPSTLPYSNTTTSWLKGSRMKSLGFRARHGAIHSFAGCCKVTSAASFEASVGSFLELFFLKQKNQCRSMLIQGHLSASFSDQDTQMAIDGNRMHGQLLT